MSEELKLDYLLGDYGDAIYNAGMCDQDGDKSGVRKYNKISDGYQDDIKMLFAALRLENQQLRSDNRRMAIQNEAMDIALHRIVSWCDAYPLDVFPEPDFKKAREILEAGGITLDSVSASNMRHVINGFRDLAQAAIDALPRD